MNLSYRPELRDKEMEQADCAKLLGLPAEEMLSLTGVYGIEPNIDNIKLIEFGGTYPRFAVHLVVDQCGLILRRTIRFDTGVIDNNYFRFKPDRTRQGYGLRMLDAQVAAATKYGFKEIHCYAFGGKLDNLGYSGHIVWAKLGFVPIGSSVSDIASELSKSRPETTLQELVQTEEGSAFWHEFGIDWNGAFDLSADSKSRYILIRYKEQKTQFQIDN